MEFKQSMSSLGLLMGRFLDSTLDEFWKHIDDRLTASTAADEKEYANDAWKLYKFFRDWRHSPAAHEDVQLISELAKMSGSGIRLPPSLNDFFYKALRIASIRHMRSIMPRMWYEQLKICVNKALGPSVGDWPYGFMSSFFVDYMLEHYLIRHRMSIGQDMRRLTRQRSRLCGRRGIWKYRKSIQSLKRICGCERSSAWIRKRKEERP